jgi:type IV pilus assembly protein PilOP
MNGVMLQLQKAPWLWPRQTQRCLWGCMCCLSFIASCIWLGEGEEADRLQAQHVQHAEHVQTIQVLQDKLLTTRQDIERIVQTTEQKRGDTLPNVMQHLKTSATTLGLRLDLLVEPQPVDMRQVPFEVYGQQGDVWLWWQRAQRQSSALVLTQLNLRSEGDRLQMRGRWLWSPIGLLSFDEKAQPSLPLPLPLPASQPHTGASHHIGFDQTAWLQAQRWHAQQLPSYAKWVMPELNRQPHHLEQFELRHLRYEGMISSANKQQALVRILDGSANSYPLVLLAQGAYLGQDFGRLQSITPEHLWLREVVRGERGEWAPRWVKLPLGRLLEQAPFSKSAS